MKRYIKSTIENLYTLQEWVNQFNGPINAFVDVYTDDYEWCGDFVKLREYLKNPGKYDSSVHQVSDWAVIDIDTDNDFYVLYLESPTT